MATTQLSVPQVFTKTCREDFHQHTPQRPYITFRLGPGKLQRLVIKVWSNDQGKSTLAFDRLVVNMLIAFQGGATTI